MIVKIQDLVLQAKQLNNKVTQTTLGGDAKNFLWSVKAKTQV